MVGADTVAATPAQRAVVAMANDEQFWTAGYNQGYRHGHEKGGHEGWKTGQIDMLEHVLSLMDDPSFPISRVEPVIRRRLAELRQEADHE